MISLLAASHVDSAEASFWIGFLVVLALIGVAAWCFLHNALLAGVGLTVLAIIAAALLL
jgi:hypothetical protein